MGLYTIRIIERLENQLGGQTREKFDLIAGTSVGAIIGLALASGVEARAIREEFQRSGPILFKKARTTHNFLQAVWRLAESLLSPTYNQRDLINVLDNMFPIGMTLNEMKTRVIVPVVNMTTGRPQIFKTPHHESIKLDHNRLVSDVAQASSAAPTYFKLKQIDNQLFADGGLYANSPDLLAVHEAKNFVGVDEQDIYILSVGATSSTFSTSHADGANWGLLQWTKRQRLTAAIIGAQQASTDFMMLRDFGKRYKRIDSIQSPQQQEVLSLDNASEAAQRDLLALADSAFQSAVSDSEVNEFWDHDAQSAHPVSWSA